MHVSSCLYFYFFPLLPFALHAPELVTVSATAFHASYFFGRQRIVCRRCGTSIAHYSISFHIAACLLLISSIVVAVFPVYCRISHSNCNQLPSASSHALTCSSDFRAGSVVTCIHVYFTLCHVGASSHAITRASHCRSGCILTRAHLCFIFSWWTHRHHAFTCTSFSRGGRHVGTCNHLYFTSCPVGHIAHVQSHVPHVSLLYRAQQMPTPGQIRTPPASRARSATCTAQIRRLPKPGSPGGPPPRVSHLRPPTWSAQLRSAAWQRKITRRPATRRNGCNPPAQRLMLHRPMV